MLFQKTNLYKGKSLNDENIEIGAGLGRLSGNLHRLAVCPDFGPRSRIGTVPRRLSAGAEGHYPPVLPGGA